MATDRSYVVVLRAESAVRLPESEAAAVELIVNEARGTSTIRLRTRYVPLGQREGSIPRTLWIEAYGPADTIDEAMQRYREVAGVVGSVLSVATNASVEDIAVEIAFDATEASTDHDYFQQFLPDESGLPRASRRPDGEAFLALFGLLLSSPHRDRLLRTVSQYQIALQHLTPGHEILALAHLWMAVEALTKVARRQAADEAGGQDQLLLDWGIGKKDLDGEVRKRLIFQSDIPAYKEAAEASNGFEHGFLDFAKIRNYSTTHVGSVAGYVGSSKLRGKRRLGTGCPA
jgi:hypothetical protein